MTEQPRDWDREMASIDREIQKQGGSGAGGQVGGVRGPAAPALPVGVTPPGRSVALTWFWTLLGAALGLALVVWPYERVCGLRLAFFLGAAGLTILAAFLGATSSWANRRALAHVVSLVVIVWA